MIFLKRKTVRILSFATALFTVLAVTEYLGLLDRRKYEESLESIRLPALSALCEYSEGVSVGLRTMAVSSESGLADSRSFVREQASAALAGLYCFDSGSVEGLTEYFETVYGFADSTSAVDRERAISLSDHAAEIYYHADEIVSGILEKNISLLETDESFFEKKLDMPFEAGGMQADIASAQPLAAGGIGKNEAQKKASEIYNINSVLWRENDSEYSDGADTYNFVYDGVRVRINRADGSLYFFSREIPCSTREFTVEEAGNTALEFVRSRGIASAVMTDSFSSEFTAMFEFAPSNGDTVMLTSRIYVDVCLATGKITRYDASEYIKNYNPYKYAEDENPDLKAILPDGAYPIEKILCVYDIHGREKLCYRVKCRFRGEYYYMFYDYYTLENILTLA